MFRILQPARPQHQVTASFIVNIEGLPAVLSSSFYVETVSHVTLRQLFRTAGPADRRGPAAAGHAQSSPQPARHPRTRYCCASSIRLRCSMR